MATFAQMGGNTVTNIVVGDSKEELERIFGGTFIEYTAENPAGMGWTYDEATNTFINPVTPEPIEE